MKRILLTLLALLVLAGIIASLTLSLVFLLWNRSLGAFLQAASVPMLIVLVAGYTAGSFHPPGGPDRPAIP